MESLGYVIQQHSVRKDRPVKAYEKWGRKIPGQYAEHMEPAGVLERVDHPHDGLSCLATLKHFRSLMPMAQESRKPIFRLTSADGAIGAHARATTEAGQEFRWLSEAILERAGIGDDNSP